jgi:hypothetical protein
MVREKQNFSIVQKQAAIPHPVQAIVNSVEEIIQGK